MKKCKVCQRPVVTARYCSEECKEVGQRLNELHRASQGRRAAAEPAPEPEAKYPWEEEPVLYGILGKSDVRELERRRAKFRAMSAAPVPAEAPAGPAGPDDWLARWGVVDAA